MSTATARKTSTGPKRDVKAEATQAIMDALAKGVAPWRMPWRPGISVPTSMSTGRPYRGINIMLLSLAQMSAGYNYPLWLTYRQAEALGGNVRKGEKSTTVVFYKPMEKERADGTTDKFLLTRAFAVFNVDQTEGVEIPKRFLDVNQTPITVPDAVDRALQYKGGPDVRFVLSDKAYYEPKADAITLPKPEQFDTLTGFAETVLHEAIHSTGHKSRLDRLTDDAYFGSHHYAEEELVAEMGAGMLATMLGVDVDWGQAAAYCQSWLRVLENDTSLIIKSANKAQKAVDHILGTTFSDSENEEEK